MIQNRKQNRKKESPLNNKMSFGKGHSVLGLHLFVCVERNLLGW